MFSKDKSAQRKDMRSYSRDPSPISDADVV
jgi:hypothetical protein